MKALVIAALGALALSGCSAPWDTAYTLYRNTLVQDINPRIHVASFNASESEHYNQDNCLTAAELFQGQPGVLTKFWCERGGFKP